MTNKKLYLIGDPVDHSLSPLLHGAMIAQTGVHYTYEVRRVQPRDLADHVAHKAVRHADFQRSDRLQNHRICFGKSLFIGKLCGGRLRCGEHRLHQKRPCHRL